MSQNAEPRVFVIVLNWNGWRDTLECLGSLEKLDYPNYEVVVVDNCSTDGSVARIREAYPDVTLLQSGVNLGFAGGNNVGIRYALGREADYVWLLNNDTVAAPSALREMVDVALRDAGVGAVGSVLHYADEPDRIQAYGGGRVSLWSGISRHFTTLVPDEKLHYLAAASLLVRREVLERVGLLDDGFFLYWEDTDYAFRVRKAGYWLAVAPGASVWHKESATLGKKSAVLDTYFSASAVLFFRKHSPLPLVPICMGGGARFCKRVAQGDWKRARSVWGGVLKGRR
jgi:GT2 family glycosyltransferase